MIERDTCRIYQVYFYVNLLKTNPLKNSSIVNDRSLNKRTIKKLNRKILSTDRQENEDRIDQFMEENDIQRG